MTLALPAAGSDAGWVLPGTERATGTRSDRVASAVLVAAALLVWLPAIGTPFWGDDYVYLSAARAANEGGLPWIATFWPEQPPAFWRPLSQEAWWRVVDAGLADDARLAHLVLLAMHALASVAVGLLAWTLARSCRWTPASTIGVLAAGVYGVLALHLLPVHWVAAANSPLLVLFTSLAMAAWLAAGLSDGPSRAALATGVPLLTAAALLSKESAVLTPLLLVVLAAFAGREPRAAQRKAFAACILVVLAWLALRTQVVAPPAPQYAYGFGANLPRNAASMAAWLFNVPREALRMLATGEVALGLAWAAAVAAPVVVAVLLGCREALGRLSRRQWLLLPVFVVLAYAPYLPLAWNSYAYYAAVAAVLPAIVLARLLAGRRRAVTACVLLSLSSWLAVEGTRLADHPGLIGRARWAESVLATLESRPPAAPVHLQVDDAQRFYAIGAHGVAWRTGLPMGDIHPVADCGAVPGTCLRFAADGSVRLGGDDLR